MTRWIVAATLSALALSGGVGVTQVLAQSASTALPPRPAILVELFTSEGCSSCPPADALLREITGRDTAAKQHLITISEHVSYWDSLGWKDPYSSDVYSSRQDAYRQRFGLESSYTPQMVVNGRVPFVGSDRRALESALAKQASVNGLVLQIGSAAISAGRLSFTYKIDNAGLQNGLDLNAVVVDDSDHSSVLRGENSGRELVHVSVARVFLALGSLTRTTPGEVNVPLPPATLRTLSPHRHLVLFAQEAGAGPVAGVAAAVLR